MSENYDVLYGYFAFWNKGGCHQKRFLSGNVMNADVLYADFVFHSKGG